MVRLGYVVINIRYRCNSIPPLKHGSSFFKAILGIFHHATRNLRIMLGSDVAEKRGIGLFKKLHLVRQPTSQ
jgi:hypothetical protein